MLQDTLEPGLRALVENPRTSDTLRELALEVRSKLPDAWAARLELSWRVWGVTTTLLRAVLSALEDGAVARAIAECDPEGYDALLRPLHAKYDRYGDAFELMSPPGHVRMLALDWLRGHRLGCCCRCGEYLGGDRTLGACRYGCAHPAPATAPGVDPLSGDSLATVCGD